MEILGSRKPLLFCEGSKCDLDYKVYEKLFGTDYTVIPAGNCTSVIRSTEACNSHINTYTLQEAIGIIDSDLRSDAEIERLKANKIYTLDCNEIEMLLIDENIFKKSLQRVFRDSDQFDLFKKNFLRS